MNKRVRIALILIALICFGVALSYPIMEYVQRQQNLDSMDMLAAMRDQGLKNASVTDVPAATEIPVTQAPGEDVPEAEKPAGEEPTQAPGGEDARAPQEAASEPQTDAPASDEATSAPEAEQPGAAATDAAAQGGEQLPVATSAGQEPGDEPHQATAPASQTPAVTLSAGSPENETPEITPVPTASPTPNRRVNTGAKIWADVERIALDESLILPQYRDLYALNNDLVGWLTVSATKIDYPVMQTEDDTYYLTHDFMHNNNANGLLILDSHCDAFTPSYNLVVSGHNRKNNTMFSDLYEYYRDKRHWEAHKTIQFDSLMEERTYVVFAAFFSADYDVDEEGFRYNADIQYGVDMTMWLSEVNQYKLYDTGIDVKFGDQVLTLTTCNSTRRQNGRFVVVCRRLREGEVIE